MNQACVSLEEVFAAAGARAASLVPETSGYLTLAVADATSRLPYLHDDRAVLLTVDGNVMVPRKTSIVAPADAGRGLREVLRRLLAASTGSMPGLASAARPRSEEHDVEHVVSDIEAALIPVNRAAAKRALARLARETLRAKEMGKLRKKPSQAPAEAKPQPVAATAPAAQAAPVQAVQTAPVQAAQAAPAPVQTAPAEPAPAAPAPVETAPAEPAPAAPVQAAPPVVASPLAALAEPAPPIEPPPPPQVDVVKPPLVVAAVHEASPAPPPRIEIPPPALVVVAVHEATPAPPPRVETPPASRIEIPPPPLVETPPAFVLALGTMDEPPPVPPAPPAAPDEIVIEFSEPPTACSVAPQSEVAWQDPDATIADPDAMAVLEAHDETATVAGTLVAERSEPPPDIADVEDEDALTRPWRPGMAGIAAVAPVAQDAVAAPPAFPSPPALARDASGRVETVRLETPTAAAASSVLFTEPAGTRADELLDAFRAQDQSDALQAAARGLRAFAEVDEASAPRPASRGPARSAAPFSRPMPPIDDDLDLPPPRARSRSRSHWPLAVFALGVLVLFAAWLYRPNLAQSFFGLRDLVLSRPLPRATEERPKPGPQAAPEAATSEPAAAAPARQREARAGDPAQRRRD